MVPDKGADIVHQMVREAKPAHDRTGDSLPRLGMPVEVAVARLIHGVARGLADIVQQCGPHQRWGDVGGRVPAIYAERGELPGDRQDACDVLVHIEGVVAAVLVEPAADRELGNRRAHELGVLEHRVPAATRREDPAELDAHALAGNRVEQGRAGREGRGGLRLYIEIEPAGEADGAEHAERILLEAHARHADGADEARLEVLVPAEKIEHAAVGMPCHGVHGEVPAGEVVLHRPHRDNLLGMTAIRIEPILAVRGDLDALAIRDGGDPAELDAASNNVDARGEQRALGLLPGTGAAHVDVMARRAQQRVANPSADVPRLQAGALQSLEHAQRGIARNAAVEVRTLPFDGVLSHFAPFCPYQYSRNAKRVGGRMRPPTRAPRPVGPEGAILCSLR